jgi:hypothetical protein
MSDANADRLLRVLLFTAEMAAFYSSSAQATVSLLAVLAGLEDGECACNCLWLDGMCERHRIPKAPDLCNELQTGALGQGYRGQSRLCIFGTLALRTCTWDMNWWREGVRGCGPWLAGLPVICGMD